MEPERWSRVEELYHSAMEREGRERDAFLQEACAGDEDLLGEVRSLLGADERAERFIEEPAAAAATQGASADRARSWVGQRIGSYQVVSPLGAGGMGEVYRAKDTKLGREVALKVLPEAFSRDRERLDRFDREARVLAALNHPGIATLYGLEEFEGLPFLVLELVEGETLGEWVAGRPRSVDKVLPLLHQMARALEAAHAKGIIHRDLKPANVKVTPEGQVKLLDFGLAKALRGGVAVGSDVGTVSAWESQTGEGRVLGTVAYMSPEQARGQPLDKRTDIWSFGCVLYEALTGRRAFGGGTVSDTLAAILEHDVDWEAVPVTTPAVVRSLLRRCLQKDRDRRLRDIGDAGIEIEEAMSAPAASGPTHAAGVRAGSGWRQALPWASTAALAVIAALALWAAGHGESPRRSGLSVQPNTMRFAVSVPPEYQLFSQEASPPIALSSGGKRLVYEAVRSGRRELFLRSLDQIEAKPLLGTEGGRTPFFSPDGEWVGFFTTDTLQKVPVAGGTPVKICDLPARENSTGGSWGPDDTIVFSTKLKEGIWRVPAAGGAPEKVGPGRWPQLLPDGKHVLASVRPDNRYWQPAVLSLETGESRTLGRGRAGARYVSSGHLVYGESGNLMAVRFDPLKLELQGAPRPVLHDVYMHPYDMAFVSVSDAGTLAYVPGRNEASLKWVDREGRATPAVSEGGDFEGPRVSPDGRHVVVRKWTDGRAGLDLWVHDLERGSRRRLVNARGGTFGIWTPDGSGVTYNLDGSLYSRTADGSGEKRLILAQRGFPRSWSPEGRILAFGTNDDIWMLPAEGEPTAFLATPVNEKMPSFSPDGRWLAYVSNESGRDEVYAQPYPGPGTRWMISTEGGLGPVWSPDGRELFYRDIGGRKMMVVSFTSEPMVRVGKPRLLFAGQYYQHTGALQYDIHPDGQRFLMIERPQARSVNVVLNWFDELNRLVPEDE